MFNVQQFLEDYNVEYITKGKNVATGFVNVQCQYCDDPSQHGAFSLQGNVYLCWRCGKHDVAETLALLTGIDKREIYQLKKKYDDFIDIDQQQVEYHNTQITVPGSKLTSQHRAYLASRRFDVEYLEHKYDLRGTLATGDLYAYRIIAPIYLNKRIVSYQGRDFTGKQQLRYATCKPENEIVHHKKILYNLDNAQQRKVIVVEGVYDVFRFGDDTIATMGTSYTREQVALICDKYDQIYTMFDPEKDAQSRAKQLLYDLAIAGKQAVNILLDEGDPAEQNDDTVRAIKRDLKI
jgi:hypothetical protein